MSPSALFVTTVPITLEAFLAPFAEHFREQGWRVDALANGASADSHIADSFDDRFDVAWSRNPLAPSNLIGSAGRVRRLVTAGDYDIVHVHTPIAAFVTRYALRSKPAGQRPSIIYTAHGFHFYEGGSPITNRVYRFMERLAARWTDYLVTINQEDFSAACALDGIDPSHVRLIPGIGVDTTRFDRNTIDSEQVAAIRPDLGVDEDAFMITMVAEMAAVKRHDHVLKALAATSRPDVLLVLVGTGPLEPQLHATVAELGLADRVRFAGYRRDIPAILAASDALLLASEREGLARSVLEGMAAGLPIIGTDTRGIADAVGSDSGWIVPKRDVHALARTIDEASADRAEAARRGANGQRRAREQFALPRIITAYEELYREALAAHI